MNEIVLILASAVGVFLFFRVEKLTDVLIGEGKIQLVRQRALNKQVKNKNYSGSRKSVVIDKLYRDRLRDAILRKSIYEIEEIIIRIAIQESYTIENTNPYGYRRNFEFFTK